MRKPLLVRACESVQPPANLQFEGSGTQHKKACLEEFRWIWFDETRHWRLRPTHAPWVALGRVDTAAGADHFIVVVPAPTQVCNLVPWIGHGAGHLGSCRRVDRRSTWVVPSPLSGPDRPIHSPYLPTHRAIALSHSCHSGAEANRRTGQLSTQDARDTSGDGGPSHARGQRRRWRWRR